MSTEISKIPTIDELQSDALESFKSDQLNYLLNQPVPQSWVRHHPFVKMKDEHGKDVPLSYIPIDRVEYLLTKIFKQWRVEIKEVKQIFNAVVVQVRLHFLNPVTGEWTYHDGVGAVGVQTDKGASAADLDSIKANAIQIAAPAAESYAVKDAADKIGVLFGKDLGRASTLNFAMTYKPREAGYRENIAAFTNEDDLLQWAAEQSELHGDKEFEAAVFARRAQLQKSKA